MQKQFITFISIISILLVCCDKKTTTKLKPIKGNEDYYVKYIYEDDVLISEQVFTKDANGKDIAQGYYKEYYQNGKLKKEYSFFENKRWGLQIEYNEFNFETQIANYLADTAFFVISFNDNLQLDSIKGEPLHASADSRVVHLDDTILLSYDAIESHNIKTKFIIKKTLPNGSSKDTTIKFSGRYSSLTKHYTYYNPTIFTNLGKYAYNVEIVIYNKRNGHTIVRDRFIDTIIVSPR